MIAFPLAGTARRKLSLEDELLLTCPEAQPIIARLGASVDPEFPHRIDHVRRVACCVLRAKRNPSNVYARPTL